MASNLRSFRAYARPSDETSFASTACGLSIALDKAVGRSEGHTLRSCLIGLKIGHRAGLSDGEMHALYYALLFKDIGTTGEQESGQGSARGAECALLWSEGTRALPAHRVLPAMLAMVIQCDGVHPTIRLFENLATAELRRSVLRRRRILGAQRLRNMGLPPITSEAVTSIDLEWRKMRDALPQQNASLQIGQIVKLAQTLEQLQEAYGKNMALDVICKRCKGFFDPGLVAAAVLSLQADSSWNRLHEANLAVHVASLEPPAILQGSLSVDRLCEVFAQVIDTRSQHMMRHSLSVARLACNIAREMHLSDWQITLLRRACLLHDLGNLSIPPEQLDRLHQEPKHDARELQHAPLITHDLLSSIPGFSEVASIAAMHRERLDGSGRPFGMTRESINLPARILAVAEIAENLAAGRYPQTRLNLEEVLRAMEAMAPDKLDAYCASKLRAADLFCHVA